MTHPLLSLQGLTKAYPGVVANDQVSFDIGAGEVHALLGENGAGKSTLVKMIYGLVKPDSGTMLLRGEPYTPSEPRQARADGIAMVFQHFSLFDALNVAENIALGMENPPAMRDLASRIREVSETYGLPLDPYRTVGDLSAGERQRVEIIRCLLQDPKLLIMDEPTSVLTPQEVDILFQTLQKLRSEGTSILYISHKLEEIRTLCDHATILRLGKNVGECVPAETSARDMAEMMVGTALQTPERSGRAFGDVALDITGLSVPAPSAFGTALKNVHLTVRKGEILGIGGVAGNGQDELLGVLSGETLTTDDAVKLEGAPVGHLGPVARRRLGILAAPEERLGHAAAPDMSLTENAMLTAATREGLASRGFLKWGLAQEFAEKVIERFDVRTPGPQNAARSLSGGNLQKFVIGREVLQSPEVLVVNQPTWGVDAAAAAAIRQSLLDLAAGGTAVICISQDLDELMEIADSFAALNEGRLSAPRPTTGLSVDEIGLMMGGAHGMEVAHV
ncbi:ABC transporter ATP-binding protein [Phaeobacter italicus]|uniref:Ribose import ATP-binding protein RbsA n=1 Tax=Phaeobacter italicus TaxID=481446 RepID=A0A0H5DIY2_9RHOB|nr:ABC transporter ATP-binding protein [Phaeobacter italicus]EEB71902.1 sugar ABC transporter, ATP-binding protein [Ruegeria sp. R11]MBO9443675.1 ABC transporter ATP-binding protein [Phaeobacter italicus]CRL12115.1 Ribose import ATP-binding protein RbsA [Phaeobacter italicus]CRL16419.1 Ribose import ATP-binding protein RbsA [Phaeobacter italicus]SFH19741.1 nucleoside ABC transporter ATP-binding protein [Phaeobacter italicus]